MHIGCQNVHLVSLAGKVDKNACVDIFYTNLVQHYSCSARAVEHLVIVRVVDTRKKVWFAMTSSW